MVLKKTVYFLLILFVITACSDSAGVEDDGSVITLDVNVYMLESDESDESDLLTAVFDENDTSLLFEGINDVWGQVNIEWNIKKIERVTARGVEDFNRMMQREIPPSFSILHNLIPAETISPDTWDLFLIHNIQGLVGGVYFNHSSTIFLPETDPNGDFGFEGGIIRILAHELGHSLGLPHVPCVQFGNLMAPGCPFGNRTRLNQNQIEFSRSQAITGRPFTN